MLEIAIGVAVVLVALAVPRTRRAVLSLIGLLAIIVAGSAVIAVVVWALYQAKPWVTSPEPEVTEKAAVPGKQGTSPLASAETELTSALASEEEERLAEEQRALEVEKLRIAGLAQRARTILEADRIFADQAASFPLPAGIGEDLGNIISIRIPAWRDSNLAVRQAESIRTWLHSIGLKPDETKTIVTAKAWGGLYDMWIAENPSAAPQSPLVPGPDVASGQGDPNASTEPESAPLSEAGPEPLPINRPPVPRRKFARPRPPRRAEAPPRPPPPRRRPPTNRDVGPFGY
jgi:hypothetical protein